MKRTLAFKLKVDPKNVRRAVAVITGDVMPEDEFEKTFFNREPIEVEVSEDQEFAVTLGFVALMMSDDIEEAKPKKKAKKKKL